MTNRSAPRDRIRVVETRLLVAIESPGRTSASYYVADSLGQALDAHAPDPRPGIQYYVRPVGEIKVLK